MKIQINPYYTLYNDGRVYSHVTNKFIKPDRSNKGGYLRVNIWRPNKERHLVHRLVAKYFLENPNDPCKRFVNHKDGDKLNNHASNLEWVTQSENEQHAYDTGLRARTIKCFASDRQYPHINALAKGEEINKNTAYYRVKHNRTVAGITYGYIV